MVAEPGPEWLEMARWLVAVLLASVVLAGKTLWDRRRRQIKNSVQSNLEKASSAGLLGTQAELGTATKSLLEIVYANECNLNNKQSLFRRSTSFLPLGEEIKHRITKAEFYIGVKNRSNTTIRNVQIKIDQKNIPHSIISLSLQSETTGTQHVDIQPENIEYFFLGYGYIDNFVAEIVEFKPASEINMLADEINAFTSLRLVGGSSGLRSLDLLKNDGYQLDFSVFGDDVLPRRGVITVNGKSGLEVLVSPKDTQERD